MRILRNTTFLTILPLLLIIAAAPAQSNWYSVYDNALEDIAAGRWEQAITNLNLALELKPDPELNARTYGVWRKDYLPFYHLGLAHFNLGNYERAIDFFDLSLASGAIKRQSELLGQLNSYYETAAIRIRSESPEMELATRIEKDLNLGMQLESRGELDSAQIKFESVISLEPGNALATEHLQEILARLAGRDSLIARQSRAGELIDSGLAELGDGRSPRALELFGQALEIDPGNKRVPVLIDSARVLQAGIEEQRQRRDQLIGQLIEEGNAALAAGDLRQAAEQFGKALKIDPASRNAAQLAARTDSLLVLEANRLQRERLLVEAVRLVERDSLLVARDSLTSARQLGPDPRVDSLLLAIESRINESGERFRLRDIPQLVVSTADSVLVVRLSSYIASGSAIDDDGIVRIVMEVNGNAIEMFRFNGTGQAPVRQAFERAVELSPGSNRIKYTVFDRRGNNSAVLRTVIYDPPFWKMPLIRYLMALSIILAAAGAYYVRRNTFHLLFNKLRRRPFVQISPNPYIVGNPIRSREMFFGREDDFRFVKNKVDNEKYGSLIVLFGERRAGKTSVLYQILGGRLGPSYLPVFLDMQAMAINNDNEFLGRLAEITTDQLGARIGKTDLSRFEEHSRNPYPLFEKFIDKSLEAIGEDKLLFLLDEYELLEDKVADGKIRKEIFHFLSGLVEHKPGLFLIFAGNHRLQDRRHSSYWEPLLQRCDYRNISYLTPNDTRRLIQDPVRGKVFFVGTTVRDIMRLTAGQPFYTQLVCRNMVELLNDERRNFFYEADIIDVVREIIDNPPPQLIYFWAGMESLEKLVLSTVAEAARHTGSFPDLNEMRHALKKYSAELAEDELKKVCERMTGREVLERGPRESYRFRMDLYRLWIREEHNLYSVAREFERDISPVNK